MFEVTIQLGELEAFQQALTAMPARVEEVLISTMREAEDIGLLALTVHPESMPFPPSEVKWDSPTQRAAYHWTHGFGGGDPYQRKGALNNALEESDPTSSGGLTEGKVYAVEDWVKYVIGSKDQSDIHIGRWKTDETVAGEIRPEIVELFSNNLLRAVQEALSAK